MARDCTCDWEDVTTFEDKDTVFERTTPDPDCTVHAVKE